MLSFDFERLLAVIKDLVVPRVSHRVQGDTVRCQALEAAFIWLEGPGTQAS